jgi:hypothetical protein
MRERLKLLGLRLTGQHVNPAAVAHAQHERDILGNDELNALPLGAVEDW